MCATCCGSTCYACDAELDGCYYEKNQGCPNGCPTVEDAFLCDCGEYHAKTDAVAVGHSGELLCSSCAPELGFCEYNHAEYERSLAEYEPDALDRIYEAFKNDERMVCR